MSRFLGFITKENLVKMGAGTVLRSIVYVNYVYVYLCIIYLNTDFVSVSKVSVDNPIYEIPKATWL